MNTPSSAGTLPPFIPGLLIVSLLILVSILVGWRNYLRRGNPESGTAEWTAWRPAQTTTTTSESRNLERPKLWDIEVGERDQMRKGFGAGWEKVLPLSATTIEPDHPPDESNVTNDIPMSPSPPASSTPNWLPRLKYFSSKAPLPPPEPVQPSPMPPPPPLHQVQLSFIISMPDPSCPTCLANPSSCNAASPDEMDLSDPNSSMQHVSHSHHTEHEHGPPEVAFGLIVVPWDKGMYEENMPLQKEETDAESQ